MCLCFLHPPFREEKVDRRTVQRQRYPVLRRQLGRDPSRCHSVFRLRESSPPSASNTPSRSERWPISLSARTAACGADAYSRLRPICTYRGDETQIVRESPRSGTCTLAWCLLVSRAKRGIPMALQRKSPEVLKLQQALLDVGCMLPRWAPMAGLMPRACGLCGWLGRSPPAGHSQNTVSTGSYATRVEVGAGELVYDLSE